MANTVTDADGNYLFENVQPGVYIVAWDLSNLSTDFRITSDGVSGNVGGFANTADFEVQGGTTHLNVDLGLAPIVDRVFHDGFESINNQQ